MNVADSNTAASDGFACVSSRVQINGLQFLPARHVDDPFHQVFDFGEGMQRFQPSENPRIGSAPSLGAEIQQNLPYPFLATFLATFFASFFASFFATFFATYFATYFATFFNAFFQNLLLSR